MQNNDKIEASDFSLLDLFLLLKKERVVFFGTVFVFIVAGWFYAKVQTKIYRAEAIISIEKIGSNMQGGGSNALSSMGLGFLNKGNSSNGKYIAQLNSFATLNAFIKEENIKPLIFPDYWDNEKKVWKEVPSGLFSYFQKGGEPSDWIAVKAFKFYYIAEVNIESGLLNMSIDWEDADIAAKWLAKIIKNVDDSIREQTIESSQDRIAYLLNSDDTRQNNLLKNVASSIIQSEMQKQMMATVDANYVFQVIDPPFAQTSPVRPNKKMIRILFGIIGVFLGIMFVFIRAHYRSR